MSFNLLLISLLLFLCILLSKASGKVGVPSLLLFICVGLIASVIGFASEIQDFEVVNDCSTVGLIFIMFFGGFGTNWRRAKKTAVPAILLSSVGVFLTAFCLMFFIHYVLKVRWLPSLLVGSVVSSTDAASVFSMLRSRHLNLRYGTASLLELESGSNDPAASILVVFTLALMHGQTGAADAIILILEQFGLGILPGVAIACAAIWIMNHSNITGSGFGVVFVTGVALFSYAAAACIGGNGYLSVYITGIILGNSAIPSRTALVHFFDGLTSLVQVMLFFLLGLVATPSLLLRCALPGLLIAVFLTFFARPLVVFVLLKPFHAPRNQRLLVDWCGLRGASAIVFAIVAALDSATGAIPDSYLFHTVFFIVLFSILLQGSLIPVVAKKLEMLDTHDDVMQTFSDWAEDVPMEFIQIRVNDKHPWNGRLLVEIHPSHIFGGGRVFGIIRDGKQMTPHGRTRVQTGDILIVGGESVEGTSWGTLNQLAIDNGHPWIGKQVSELALREGTTLVAIRREGRLLIPGGKTRICYGDQIVLNENSL